MEIIIILSIFCLMELGVIIYQRVLNNQVWDMLESTIDDMLSVEHTLDRVGGCRDEIVHLKYGYMEPMLNKLEEIHQDVKLIGDL